MRIFITSIILATSILMLKPQSATAQTYLMGQVATVTTCSGTFYDAGGQSNNYSNGSNNTITFSSDNGNRLQFDFQTFSTEGCCDILFIYDGISTNAPLIGQYSGTNSPGIITSSGTNLTFRFFSDGSGTGAGWTASISCTTPPLSVYTMTNGQPATTTCEGVFYDDGGANGNYTNNQNQIMTFCPNSAADYLTFNLNNQFNIAAGDTLFAYSGNSTNAPLIGIYTQNYTRGEVIASPTPGTCITFKFISNSTINESGWQGLIGCSSVPITSSFNMPSGGKRYVNSGNFYDSGGPTANYSNSEDKITTFSSNNGNRIQFSFQTFSTENTDVLRIYDGNSINAPLIGQYIGNSSPGIITSSGTSLTFRFTSDGSATYAGWAASISTTTPALTNYPMTNGQSVTTCEGVFYDNGGADGNYTSSQNQTMTFCPNNATDYLTITLPNQFYINSDDTLFAYSGNTVAGSLIGVYTQNNKGETISSPTPGACITFKFISNAITNHTGWQGFIACSTTKVTPSFTMSGGGTRYVSSGNFYDSGGPTSFYSGTEDKTITFFSDNGNRLQFNFASFSTETPDILYIYDGASTNSPPIGMYSGTNSPGIVTSSGTSLTFRFTSDGSVSYAGWAASISTTTPAFTSYNMTNGQSVMTCEGVFYDNGGADGNYTNNQNQTMTFCPNTAADYLTIRFPNQFNIASDDTLFAYSGNTTTGSLIGVYTKNNKTETITSPTPGTCIAFKFISNGTTNASGWQGLSSCSTTKGTPNFMMPSGGTRYVSSGNFYDSGGPTANYSNLEDKTTTFTSTSGCAIRFNFQNFSTEGSDILYIYDGPSTGSPLLGQYSGTTSPGIITSSGTSLTFRFISDGSAAYPGWFATISTPNTPTATITPSGSVNLCTGGSVTLTASNAASWLWNTGATTQSITTSTAGTYYVTLTNDVGCSATSQPINVTVNTPPETPIITASGATTFCQGDSVTLTAPDATSYLWSNNATTKSITVSTAGNYTVTVTNTNGCSATSAATTVNINPAPAATITASGTITFCQGGSVTLTASDADSYLWSNGATTKSITVSTTGDYTVTVTNANGCSATSLIRSVTVNPVPVVPTITISGSTTFCQGDSVTLSAPDSASYLYEWSNGALTRSITVSTAGDYTVTVYNNETGCAATSATTTITVNPAPEKPTITTNGDTTFCQGGSVTLTAPDADSYLWSNDATTKSITVSTAGNYTVTVTNSKGCSATSAAKIITVNPAPTATITAEGSTTICQGDSVTLTASDADSYLWSNGATTKSITVTTAEDYTVTVTNVNGCDATSEATTVTVNPVPEKPTITTNGDTTFCQGEFVMLTAPDADSYLWSNGATTKSITVSTAGDYTVTVTNTSGCDATSAAKIITVNPAPTATITAEGSTTICQGDSVTLTASDADSYLWSNGATTKSITVSTAEDYTVTVTNANGCDATSEATTVTVNPVPEKPTITANGPLLTSSSLTNNQWYLNGNNIPGAVSQTYLALENGDYTVRVTNINGCYNTSDPYTLSTVGIGNNTNIKNNVVIFPNPTNGKFIVEVRNMTSPKCKIYNMVGEVIYQSDLTTKKEIDLSNYAKGVYFIQIETTQQVITERIVIE